jgi:hypothetical protein
MSSTNKAGRGPSIWRQMNACEDHILCEMQHCHLSNQKTVFPTSRGGDFRRLLIKETFWWLSLDLSRHFISSVQITVADYDGARNKQVTRFAFLQWEPALHRSIRSSDLMRVRGLAYYVAQHTYGISIIMWATLENMRIRRQDGFTSFFSLAESWRLRQAQLHLSTRKTIPMPFNVQIPSRTTIPMPFNVQIPSSSYFQKIAQAGEAFCAMRSEANSVWREIRPRHIIATRHHPPSTRSLFRLDFCTLRFTLSVDQALFQTSSKFLKENPSKAMQCS